MNCLGFPLVIRVKQEGDEHSKKGMVVPLLASCCCCVPNLQDFSRLCDSEIGRSPPTHIACDARETTKNTQRASTRLLVHDYNSLQNDAYVQIVVTSFVHFIVVYGFAPHRMSSMFMSSKEC